MACARRRGPRWALLHATGQRPGPATWGLGTVDGTLAKERIRRVVRVAATVAACAAFLAVMVFMVVGSLRMPGLPPPDGWEWLPDPVTWGNYELVLQSSPEWPTALRNSALIVAVAVPVTVVVASGAGFVMATGSPRRRFLLVAVSVIALLVPASALWIPRFAVFRWLGLTDTLLAVMAPALIGTSPFYVLLFAFAYWRMPANLFEAARVEGASELHIWWRVAVPLGRPAVFAVAMLAFTFHWSNLIDPLLYLSSPERVTLPLALARLRAFEPSNFPLLLAGATLVTLPAAAVFLLAQRAFLVHTISGRTR